MDILWYVSFVGFGLVSVLFFGKHLTHPKVTPRTKEESKLYFKWALVTGFLSVASIVGYVWF